MEQQQYTIQILDKDDSTDLVTSKQSCLIGRSLISDIRIHLPSVKEMHLEIDMKNRRVTSYGNDVRVNDVEVEVNGTVDYEYGDVISLRNKRFVVHKNKEHREGRGLPLVVSAERAFGEQVQPSAAPLRGRFNMSPSRPRRSEEAAPALHNAPENTDVAEDAGSKEVRVQGSMSGEEEALSSGDPENSARPSFFNATDSSIDSIIAREKEHVDSEIRSNIEFDVSVLQTSVAAKNNRPMDLKEAVLEKTVLEDIMEGKQEAERAAEAPTGQGSVHGETEEGAQESVGRVEEEAAGEQVGGGADTASAAENMPHDIVRIRKEVLLVTERTVRTLRDTPPEPAADIPEASEATESKADAALEASEEVPCAGDMGKVLGNPESIETSAHAECAGEGRSGGLESAEEEVPAGEGGAEGKDGEAVENTKRRSVNNDLGGEPPKEESEMAGTKYSSASRRVENLVDSLNKEEERRAGMGVLAKKAKSADSASTRGEVPQRKMGGVHKKEEEPAEKAKKPAHTEAGPAKRGERSLPRKKADAGKKEPSSGRKSRGRETAEEPLKKRIRLASAASSQKDEGTPPKSRRKAAVPEKASKNKKPAQQAAAKKEAPKKAPAAPRKKKDGEETAKKKAKKTARK